MKGMKDIIRRAMKNGFDLSFIEHYNEKEVFQGLYEYLVINKYYCSMEGNVIYVGHNIVEDVAQVSISNKTLEVHPLSEKGFFDILMTLFKYISHVSKQEPPKEEDISTEEDEDDSSEELWL
jgi:hypothetical protein